MSAAPSFPSETIKSIARLPDSGDWEGYVIHTETNFIQVGISTFQSCCEDWGAKAVYPEGRDASSMIGKRITRVHWAPEERRDDSDSEENKAAVLVETEAGTIRVQLWNNHNGYYSHDIVLEWEGHKDQQKL